MAEQSLPKSFSPIKQSNRPRSVITPGQRFARLVFLYEVEPVKERRMGLFQCDCGKKTITQIHGVRYGNARSCGCLVNEFIASVNFKHGEGSKTSEFNIWSGMRERCSNPNHVGYKNYGGRGITVCDRWANSYINFLADMGRRPSLKHSINRIDNDGNYCPENCEWTTQKRQGGNTRLTIFLVINGVRKALRDWADEVGIPAKTVWQRMKNGWSADRAVFEPIHADKIGRRFR